MVPMTPKDRARILPTMSTEETSVTELENREIERSGDLLGDAPSEELAELLEERGPEVQSAAEEVAQTLANGGALTDVEVGDLWEAAGALTAVSRTLSERVDERHRVENQTREDGPGPFAEPCAECCGLSRR
jgi:hypothetical protein